MQTAEENWVSFMQFCREHFDVIMGDKIAQLIFERINITTIIKVDILEGTV